MWFGCSFRPAALVTFGFPTCGLLLVGEAEVSSRLSTGIPDCSHSLIIDQVKPIEQLDMFISQKLSFLGSLFL